MLQPTRIGVRHHNNGLMRLLLLVRCLINYCRLFLKSTLVSSGWRTKGTKLPTKNRTELNEFSFERLCTFVILRPRTNSNAFFRVPQPPHFPEHRRHVRAQPVRARHRLVLRSMDANGTRRGRLRASRRGWRTDGIHFVSQSRFCIGEQPLLCLCDRTGKEA